MALMPRIGRVRVLRHWGGTVDMSMDGSPIIDRTAIPGLYINAGWCYGGFKATPASGLCFAHLLARDAPHEAAAAYRLDRFATGHVIDEKGMGPHPNLH
jgi:sarcosine oxidase subunit beta